MLPGVVESGEGRGLDNSDGSVLSENGLFLPIEQIKW